MIFLKNCIRPIEESFMIFLKNCIRHYEESFKTYLKIASDQVRKVEDAYSNYQELVQSEIKTCPQH